MKNRNFVEEETTTIYLRQKESDTQIVVSQEVADYLEEQGHIVGYNLSNPIITLKKQ